MKENELESMRKSFKTVYEKRKQILNSPQTKKLQENVLAIKKEAIEHYRELLEIAKDSFKANDIDCIFAKDDIEARDVIYDIIKSEDVDTVAKSKSNTLGEIAISKYLKSKNIDVVETDLGDRILQLKGTDNKPTHPTGPASHLNVAQIASIVNDSMDVNVEADPKAIMKVVREDVLNRINTSTLGISGANAIASEDGSLVFIHNEGNISLISLMKTHIVVVGIDKLLRTIEDAISLVKLETIYATGSKVTSYINIVSGPSKTADIEKKLIKNMYGAEKVIVIILDNGRSEAIADIDDCLLCIGCGSCIVTCPVYNVIGNEFGFNNYLGGRGVAMSKFIEDNETSYNSGLYMCTLCGLCTINCPVAIPTNEIIEKIRSSSQKEGFYPKKHGKFRDNIKNRNSPY
ncbi:lactate utilization protein B [Methanobrevibacter cuticularis]|uniref:Lactate utilization protein B n=1 Tax=Methanobrevibacter cuticularis TaxID=47311 RepID=A0A166CH20_9EURY|nr:LUD domain-containing protein [Methanobrevibacter cuticularis]KZX14500.1 lactate utilization protein B [Methanobrevibacter cuticularis]